jgi:hypothetical protein
MKIAAEIICSHSNIIIFDYPIPKLAIKEKGVKYILPSFL